MNRSAATFRSRQHGLTGAPHSAGFTLLEVLLALALSAVLLAAVYAAFDLYARFSIKGHDDIEQAQIGRALLRKMSSDIRSVVYREATQQSSSSSNSSSQSSSSSGNSGQSGSGGSGTGGSGSGQNQSGRSGGSSASGNSSSNSSNSNSSNSSSNNSSSSSSSSNEEETVVDASAGFSSAMTGLVGDATTMVLHVARATRADLQPATLIAEGMPANSGEEKSVSYFLADASANGLAGIVGDTYKKANKNSGDIQGLARLEGNRLAIQIAEEQSDMDALAANAVLLAPEVMDLEFRYFDGEAWQETWDSGVSKGLPQAIEITLKIQRTGKKDKKPKTGRDAEPASDIYQLTVAVSSAKPYIPTQERNEETTNGTSQPFERHRSAAW